MEAHKQMSTQIFINQHETETKWFTKNEKDLSLDDLIDKFDEDLKFHGMGTEFYLPDPKDGSTMLQLCYLLHEDIEFQPKTSVAHFQTKASLYNEYSMNSMQYTKH